MKADSDHHPFFAAGLPIIMLHTGLHDDYHRPSDKAEKVNPAGLQKVSQLLFRTAHRPGQRRHSPQSSGPPRAVKMQAIAPTWNTYCRRFPAG